MSSEPSPKRTGARRAIAASGALVCALSGFALLRPPAVPDLDLPERATPFRWDADALFDSLEAAFVRAATVDANEATAVLDALTAEGRALLAALGADGAAPRAALARLASLQFDAAVQGAARPALLPRVQALLSEVRRDVLRAATSWPADRATHEALYRILVGGRVALDEALAQAGVDALPTIGLIEDVASAAPSIVVEGVRIHSGDVLLSRGGAPTSSLIARGNDFPSTFSHVALAHVSETGEASVIESLIEAGSVVSTVDDYLAGKKTRILVLRLRPDHPALLADPLVAHRAAEAMLTQVRDTHLPYDFAMAWQDPAAAFCSEIVYHAYRAQGIDLWTLRSAMSAPGLVRWLGAMGVREFTSLVPSDVELDPQLRSVAEWRDARGLMDYRLDNAVLDALLENAERGTGLGYAWYALPAARLLKAYSIGRQAVGAHAPIPAGMSASTALLVDALVTRVHPAVKGDLSARAARFRAERGYEAPYWALVGLARESVASRRDGLAPALSAR